MFAGENAGLRCPKLIPVHVIGGSKHFVAMEKTHEYPLSVGSWSAGRPTVESVDVFERGFQNHLGPEFFTGLPFIAEKCPGAGIFAGTYQENFVFPNYRRSVTYSRDFRFPESVLLNVELDGKFVCSNDRPVSPGAAPSGPVL